MTSPPPEATTERGRPSAARRVPFRPPAIVLILLAGLALRLLIAYVLLPGEGLGSDLRLFGRWAQVLVDFGPGGFYRNAGFADYPPGYLWILWLLGLVGNGIAGFTHQPPAEAIALLLKLPAILADLAIGFVLYRAAARWGDRRAGLVAAALFLFIPATWYDSAVWGQIDSVGSLLLLGGILLLLGGWSEAAVAMAILATLTKPQYGIGLVVIGAVLLRRHLLRRGSGPVPTPRGWLATLDRRLGGWFTSQQGFRRLLACAAVGAAAGILALLPFDLPIKGPVEFWDVPVIGHLVGLVAVVSAAATFYSVLTVNAFNIWALVGPTPLSHAVGHEYFWTYDSVSVVGDIEAATIGQGLLAVVAIVVATALLIHDDRRTTWIGFTVLAVAFFAVPTRVHERYLFPALVTGALLAATSARWRWWFVLLGLACVANLHAILTLNYPGYGTPGVQSLPLGDFLRNDPAVIAVALTNTALFVGIFVAFVREVPWAAVAPAARSAVSFVLDPMRARLATGPPSGDRTEALAAEGEGRIDRRDLVLAALLVVFILGMRTVRLGTPPTLYFDEIFHARTAMEFLQDWRYGISHDLYETTHPHVAKYIIAGGIVAFGDNRVTETTSVGAPVFDVAVEPAFVDSSAQGGLGGDRIAMATGEGVRIASHGAIDTASVLDLPGAVAVGFDSAADRLYIGTQDGGLWVLGGPALAALEGRILAPPPIRLAGVEGSVRHIWAVGSGRVAVATATDELIVVDGNTGAVVASAPMAGLTALVPLPIEGRSLAIAALPSGLREVDTSTLATVAELGLDARPGGAVLLEGSDFLHRNREMLSVPTLYVATAASRVETVTIGPAGELTPAGRFAMPGPVSDVRWDRPTNLVHVLGTSPRGQPTIYVVEPNGNAVFADAELPFEPVAWTLDVQPSAPALDRQRGLAFSPIGSMAVVDVGTNAFAWRFLGVLAGALTIGLLFLLTRMLFRRRTVGYLLAILLALDGLLFAQSRIAMNDTYLGLFIVAAFTLLALLLRQAPGGRRARLGMLLGLPCVGILLGLALGTKWVGAYAMGGALLIVLLRSRIGRRIALGGMAVLTAIFGYQALAGTPANYVFPIIMVGLTLLMAAAIVHVERPTIAGEITARTGPSWTDPARMFGLPFGWAMLCLAVLPLAIYVVTFVPWALTAGGDPQLIAGWPPGHTGRTFLDLQVDMYRYHNELRAPHGASSPWWAWPFDLKPIWGYYETFVDGSESIIMGVGNPVLLWLSISASGFGAWQAWRRRSPALAFVLVAFATLWLPWARIDRVAYNYHFYTALPFALILLAYFLAELWHGPSRRAWFLARFSFAAVLLAPALLWIWRHPLCAVSGVATRDATAFACTRPISDVAIPVGIWFLASLAAGFLILGARRPRRLVVVILGAAVVAFLALYPGLAAWPLPPGWGLAFQGLLPSWDGTFLFSSNTAPVSVVPLLGVGPLVLLVLLCAAAWWVMRAGRDLGDGGPSARKPPPDTPDGGDGPPTAKSAVHFESSAAQAGSRTARVDARPSLPLALTEALPRLRLWLRASAFASRVRELIPRGRVLGLSFGWTLVALVALSCAAALVVSRFAGPGGPWLWNFDMQPANYPAARFFHEALSHGSLPLWDDRIGLGYPRYAEGQIGSFYPPNWLIYQLAPLTALDVARVVHLTLAGVGAGLITMRLSGSRLGALTTALLVVLCGGIVSKLEWTQVVVTYGWMPWVLLPLVYRRGPPTGRHVAVAGGLWAIQALAFHPPYWVLTGIAAAAILLTRSPNLLGAVKVLAFGVIGIALGAIQIVPTLLVTLMSVRSEGLEPSDLFQFSATPFDFLGLAFANALVPTGAPWWDLARSWYPGGTFAILEVYAYVGLPALALAAVGLRGRGVRPFLVLALVAVAIPIIGVFQPAIWADLPGLGGLRHPVRAYLILDLALAVAAGIGVARLRRLESVRAPVILVTALVGGYALMAAMVTIAPGVFDAFVASRYDPSTSRQLAGSAMWQAWPLVLELGAAGLMLAVMRLRWPAVIGRAAAVALVAAPLALLVPGLNQAQFAESFSMDQTSIVAAVRAASPHRVVSIDVPFYAGFPDQSERGFPDLYNVSSLELRSTANVRVEILRNPGSPLALAVGVDTEVVFGRPCPAGTELAYDQAFDARICRLDNAAKPPYWLPATNVVLPSVTGGSLFAPVDATISPEQAIAEARPAAVRTWSPGQAVVEVNQPEPGYLLIDRAWWPAWNVTVDGHGVTPLRAFGVQLIPVAAGHHVIEEHLVLIDVLVGAMISGLGLLILGSWLVWTNRRRTVVSTVGTRRVGNGFGPRAAMPSRLGLEIPWRVWQNRVGVRDVLAASLLITLAVILPGVISAISGSFQLPRDDDWIYRRIALHLFHTGRLEFDGANATALLGQLAFSQPFLALSRGEGWAFGVATAVLAAAGVMAAYLLGRTFLPVSRAVLAVASVLIFPGFLLNTTSFMTDAPAWAAELVCLSLGGVALARHGTARWLWLGSSLATGVFAFTVREFALAAPVAVLIATSAGDSRRRPYLAAALVVVLSCGLLYTLISQLPNQYTLPFVVSGVTANADRQAVATLAMIVSPFLAIGALAWWSRLSRAGAVIGAAVGLLLWADFWVGLGSGAGITRTILGNLLEPEGSPGRGALAGYRPTLFVTPTWELMNALAAVSLVAALAFLGGCLGMLLRRSSSPALGTVRAWIASPPGLLALFAGLYGCGILTFGLVATMYDRYLWPLVIPLAALLLIRRTDVGPARIWRVGGALTAGLATILVGASGALLLNSDAFDAARWRMGNEAVARGIPAQTVDAGMEWVGYHASGVANPHGVAAPNEMWYAGWWPSFQLCAMVSSSPIDFPGFQLEAANWQAYRLLFFAGPEEPLYLYRVAGPDCPSPD